MSKINFETYIFDNMFDFDFITDEKIRNDYFREFKTWISFISKLLLNVEGIKIYVKGGTPLGIDVLKRYVEGCKNKNVTIMDVLQLKLIKDWDFMTIIKSEQKFNVCIRSYDAMRPYMKKKDTAGFMHDNPSIQTSEEELVPCVKLHEIMNIAQTHNIRKEGSKMIIIRKAEAARLDEDNVFFEMMIKTDDNLAEVELPMTTTKVLLTKQNYKQIFFLSKIIFAVTEYNVDIEKYRKVLKYILDRVKIVVYPHDKDGFLIVTKETYSTGELSSGIIAILNKVFTDCGDKQFIASQMSHPDSIFYRLFAKNIPKCDKIRELTESCVMKTPTYLINETRTKRVVKKFLNELASVMHTIAKKNDLKRIESVIKLYYDAKDDLLEDRVQIANEADIDNFVKRFDTDKVSKFDEKLRLHLKKAQKSNLISLSKKTIDVVEFVYLENVKKFQDAILEMLVEYDKLFEGVNIGRLSAQFEKFIEDDKSKILMSKISVRFSSNAAERIRVTKGVRSGIFMYKLSTLTYDSDAYNKLLKY